MKKQELRQVISGSLLIAGTTVGAGMLGIPLLTARAGFWPAMVITLFAWGLMMWTGLLFLEVTLWMPVGSNLLSMARRFFGKKGQLFAGVMFLFLYYCLLVAYYAAGAPMLSYALSKLFGLEISSVMGFAFFGLLFGGVISLGAKWIDRTNLILVTGMVLTYFLLIGVGAPEVDMEKVAFANWPVSVLALPVLFSAFGYHNVIPSLTTYFKKNKDPLRLSVVIGSFIPLLIYLVWQLLVIGIIPQEGISEALAKGVPVTAALHGVTGNHWIFRFGQAFAFFAIITSLLGVAFSMVDFLADGMKVERKGWMRVGLTLLTFFPPFVFVTLKPEVFDQALGVAGGIGEAILNGLIPVALVWVGRYRRNIEPVLMDRGSSKAVLVLIATLTLFVMVLEVLHLMGLAG
ncbi:MAG: Tyrosine-specific transport protein [Chlamydiae bacterium]|nr:Tyrosine-specific transport protein [Chlamydiota bacterium]